MKPVLFRPGNKYTFTVVKEYSAGEQDDFWVLESPFKTRHLLKKTLYPNFSFKKGDEIICRIDKINCSGRIFLEPENPFYREGCYYDFIFSHKDFITNTIGEKQEIIIFKGRSGEMAVLSLKDGIINLNPGDTVTAGVLRIKKGVLILVRNIEEEYKYLHSYPFRVQGEGLNHKKDPVIILGGENGRKCSVQKDNYKYYGIKAGNLLTCTITGFNIDGSCIPEPEHPYLKAGRCYKFQWLRKEFLDKPAHDIREIHIVRDYKGNEQAVAPVNDELMASFRKKDSSFIIIRFHKGKLVLMPQI